MAEADYEDEGADGALPPARAASRPSGKMPCMGGSLAARDTHVVTPHFKRRLSGVTTSLARVVPIQAEIIGRHGLGIAAVGPGLPASVPRMRGWLGLSRRPKGTRRRVWHARRNVEMVAGVVLRDVLRLPFALVFTSASQREHKPFTRWLIARMDRVVATSERGKAFLRVPATVVHHGMDAELFQPTRDRATLRRELGLLPGRRYVGCFGRLRERKGTGDFVEAMIEILPERPEWTAIVAGRTTASHQAYVDGLIERVKKAGLADRVRFVGEHRAIHRWYAALDLFVAPQRWEGFGLTPLEAMASGVPVVATRVGAFEEIVTPETGALVPPEDVAALAAATAKLMDDHDRRSAAASAAQRRIAEGFALESEAEALCLIYLELLQLPSLQR